MPALAKVAKLNRQANDIIPARILRKMDVVIDNLSRVNRDGFRLVRTWMAMGLQLAMDAPLTRGTSADFRKWL